ncbi:hypothetical protein ACM66B_004346 [Microbotryomycetes sp. NB124-2]
MPDKDLWKDLLQACTQDAELTSIVERLQPVLHARVLDESDDSFALDTKPVASDLVKLLRAKTGETTAVVQQTLVQGINACVKADREDSRSRRRRRRDEQVICSILQALKLYLDSVDPDVKAISAQARSDIGKATFKHVSQLIKEASVSAVVKRKALDVLDYGITHHKPNKLLLLSDDVLGMRQLGETIAQTADFGVTERATELAFRLRDVLKKTNTDAGRAKLKVADQTLWAAVENDKLRAEVQERWVKAKTDVFEDISKYSTWARPEPSLTFAYSFRCFTATKVEIIGAAIRFSAEVEETVAVNMSTLAIVTTKFSENEDDDALEQVIEIAWEDIAGVSVAKADGSVVVTVKCSKSPTLDAVKLDAKDKTIEIRVHVSDSDERALLDILETRKVTIMSNKPQKEAAAAVAIRLTPPRAAKKASNFASSRPATKPDEGRKGDVNSRKRAANPNSSSDLDDFFAKPTTNKRKKATAADPKAVPVPAPREVRVGEEKDHTSSYRVRSEPNEVLVKTTAKPKRALKSFPTQVDVLEGQATRTSPRKAAKTPRSSKLKARFDLPAEDSVEQGKSSDPPSPISPRRSSSQERPSTSVVGRVDQRAPLTQAFNGKSQAAGGDTVSVSRFEELDSPKQAAAQDETEMEHEADHMVGQSMASRRKTSSDKVKDRVPLQDLAADVVSARDVAFKLQLPAPKSFTSRLTHLRDSGVGLINGEGNDIVQNSDDSEADLRVALSKKSPGTLKKLLMTVTATLEEGNSEIGQQPYLPAGREVIELSPEGIVRSKFFGQRVGGPNSSFRPSMPRPILRDSPKNHSASRRDSRQSARAVVVPSRKRRTSTADWSVSRPAKRARHDGQSLLTTKEIQPAAAVPRAEANKKGNALFESLVEMSQLIASRHEAETEQRASLLEQSKRDVLREARKMSRKLERHSETVCTLSERFQSGLENILLRARALRDGGRALAVAT